MSIFIFRTPSSRLISSTLKFLLFKTMEEWFNNLNIQYQKNKSTEELAYKWIILFIHYEVF